VPIHCALGVLRVCRLAYVRNSVGCSLAESVDTHQQTRRQTRSREGKTCRVSHRVTFTAPLQSNQLDPKGYSPSVGLIGPNHGLFVRFRPSPKGILMKALMITPSVPGSARLDEHPEAPLSDGTIHVEVLAVGICGTDLEIVAGEYGTAPADSERLVLGHESLGRVLEAPEGADVVVGDLVVSMVRHPDPAPCVNCGTGEWDLCRNGDYTEHGIKEVHGFARERYRVDPSRVVRVDPALGILGVLTEPTSVVAKAWEVVDRIRTRGGDVPASEQRVLVTGAGPIGLLAAMIGTQRKYHVHVLDRVGEGLKPQLVAELGATYHYGPLGEIEGDFDIIIECTGAGQVIVDATTKLAPDGVFCLTGVSSGGHKIEADFGAINRGLVLENGVIVGSVNANKRHYNAAAGHLAIADPVWLAKLITRQVPLEQWEQALVRQTNDVKAVLRFAQ
jgi:glucose 1-dehydrogenase